MNEKFKNSCEGIRMTPEQKQKIYHSAKQKAQIPTVRKGFLQAHPALVSSLCSVLLLSVLCLILVPVLHNTRRTSAASLPDASETESSAVFSEYCYEYYLLLGSDTRSPKEFHASATDAMIIAQLEKNTGAIRLMLIPKDLLLYSDRTGTLQTANLLYLNDQGSTDENLSALQKTLGDQLNICLKGSVIIGWPGLIHIIDAAGGLELEVTPEEIQASVINGYITEVVQFTGISSTQLSESGLQLLDGVQSLSWSRVRDTIGEAGRQERFATLLSTLLDKLKSSSFSVLLDVITDVLWFSDEFATNLELTEITSLLDGNHNYHIIDTLSLDQTSSSLYLPDGDDSSYLAVADWEEFHRLIENFMNDQTSDKDIDYHTLNSTYQKLLRER